MSALRQLPISPRAFTLAVVAIAAFNALFGLAFAVAVRDLVWSVDIARNLSAARDLAAGEFGRNRGYLYSPLAALVTVPATWLPASAVVAGWLAARLALVVDGVRRETGGRRPIDRLALAIAAATFVPVMYDLMLGNVTIVIAAAVALVAWSRDRFATGIALGIVLATIPKPAIVPVLVWMLVYRRRALVGAIAAAGVATLIGLAVVGTGPYQAYVDVLRHPEYLDSPQYGNLALTSLSPAIALSLAVLTVLGTAVALRTGEAAGLIACLAAGLLLAPYTMGYGPVMMLLAFRPLLAVAPVRTFLLAVSGSVMVFVFLPIWALAWIGAAVAVPRARWVRLMSAVAG